MDDIAAQAAAVRPSRQQIAWQELEFIAFAHFGMNTFTDREWGEGKEDPKQFNPTDFDARQWAVVLHEAGVKLLILTAKHHDGFCLWPSKYTEHCVRNSPWREGKGDVVREVANACRAAGLKFGFYLSPWDRHEPSYGDSPKYNEHFKNQLRELLTQYGPVSEVWFDGACAEGPNGKRQVYDWDGYWKLIRELQPKAVISIVGPDVRWCGNEAGTSRESEWSVVPLPAGGYTQFDCTAADLGSRDALAKAVANDAKLVWYPAQVDTSIRPGWFYHASDDDKVRSLDDLLNVYYGAVGGNAQLLLNVPPDRRGRIHENDVKRLHELGDVLRATFAVNLADRAKTTSPSATIREYDLGEAKTFNVVMLQERIAQGQRVEEFHIDVWTDGDWKEIAHATTIGYKRLLRIPETTTTKVRVRITRSRLSPSLSAFGLFHAAHN